MPSKSKIAYKAQIILMLILNQALSYTTSNFRLRHVFAVRAMSSSLEALTWPLDRQKYVNNLFDFQLPQGRCVGLELPPEMENEALEGWSDSKHWVHSFLHHEEVLYVQEKSRPVRKSFLLGRLALRDALNDGFTQRPNRDKQQPYLKDMHGRPILPSSHMGSISHKGNIGVAIVAPSCPHTAIGVDIERIEFKPTRRNIAPKILTETEIQSLGNLGNMPLEHEILLRFSLKEAIYKAVHPLINEYVRFHDAEVTPWEDGTASCVWNLKSGSHISLLPVQANWRKLEMNCFLTSALCSKM
jgi:phosphopantetheine--protein transferase-like protein